jgi:hypothetical protein
MIPIDMQRPPIICTQKAVLVDRSGGDGWSDDHAIGVLIRAPRVCEVTYRGCVAKIIRYEGNHFVVMCRRDK